MEAAWTLQVTTTRSRDKLRAAELQRPSGMQRMHPLVLMHGGALTIPRPALCLTGTSLVKE